MMHQASLDRCYMGEQMMPHLYSTVYHQPRHTDMHSSNEYINGQMQPQMITITPHSIISPANEPIEAGALPTRRRRSDAESVSRVPVTPSSQPASERRSSVNWETMTDEEREDAQRLRRKEEAYKTALCDAYKRNTACPYGETCRFAHGENELRLPAQPRGKAHPKYKTQLCDKFSAQGHCPYGPRCQFIHKLKKGLALLDYETLLSQGRISPAREDEITTGDASHHRRAHSPNKQRYRRDSNSGYQSRRLSFEPDQVRDSGAGTYNATSSRNPDAPVYPKMQVINIEKALYVADSPNEVETSAGKHTHPDRRRSTSNVPPSRPVEFEPRLINAVHPLPNRSSSMQSLVFHGSAENLRETANIGDNRGRNKVTKIPDLSLVAEESEEALMENSLARSKKSAVNHWSEAFFGKRMDTITEDVVEPLEELSLSGNRTTDAELLIQSCDEELLAQGLYDYKYPDTSLEMLKLWKQQN